MSSLPIKELPYAGGLLDSYYVDKLRYFFIDIGMVQGGSAVKTELAPSRSVINCQASNKSFADLLDLRFYKIDAYQVSSETCLLAIDAK